MSQQALAGNTLEVKKGRLRISRLPYWAMAKFGLILGGLGCLVPAVLLAMAGFAIVHSLRAWLEGMQKININLLGRDITTIDLIAALRVQGLLATLQAIDNAGAFTAFGLIVLMVLAGGVIIGLLCLLIALGYNVLALLSGGLPVEVEGTLSLAPASPSFADAPRPPSPTTPALAPTTAPAELSAPSPEAAMPPGLAPGESLPAPGSLAEPPSTRQSGPSQ